MLHPNDFHVLPNESDDGCYASEERQRTWEGTRGLTKVLGDSPDSNHEQINLSACPAATSPVTHDLQRYPTVGLALKFSE